MRYFFCDRSLICSFFSRCYIFIFPFLLATIGSSSVYATEEVPKSTTREQVVEDLKGSMEKGFQQIDEMKKKFEELSKPVVNILNGVVDREFLQAISDLFSKSNWRLFWWTQLGAFAFSLILRLWLMRKLQPWYRRLWVDFWTLCLYLAFSLVGVPLIAIGEPFRKLVKSIWSICLANAI
ncbi:MAG: hypothetical protein IPL83_11940 [Bdellovibrionales bacterium]|nr:hypothetical protein [Bdellovibrionales bacterium]